MFGEKLKKARIEKGYKQSELGEILGLKNTTISNWEKGVSNPDVEIVAKLCNILNVTASYFLMIWQVMRYYLLVNGKL